MLWRTGGCAIFFLVILSCQNGDNKLPILGNVDISGGDTIYHQVPDMILTDQDSQVYQITKMGDQVVIADFFFTTCPTICPRVKKQMMRLHERYLDNPHVLIVSHTIDPKNDTPTRLKTYAENLGIDTKRWKFVTGEKDSLFHLADQYFVSVVDDPSAPAGFDHSGRIILLDRNRHIRGFCEGTDPESVTGFFETVDRLLAEDYGE